MTPKTTQTGPTDLNNLLAAIAEKHLFIETLETRNNDSLDFREVSVWGTQAALEAAYAAGMTSARGTN